MTFGSLRGDYSSHKPLAFQPLDSKPYLGRREPQIVAKLFAPTLTPSFPNSCFWHGHLPKVPQFLNLLHSSPLPPCFTMFQCYTQFSPFILFAPLCAVCVLSRFSRVWLFATLWNIASQAPQSMGFSRQEYWSGLPCLLPGGLPNPGTEPMSPSSHPLQVDSLTEPPGKPLSPPASAVHGILQARILEWVAISFSRESSWPRDQTQVSRIADRHFNHQGSSYPTLPHAKSTSSLLGSPCFLKHLQNCKNSYFLRIGSLKELSLKLSPDFCPLPQISI